MLLSLVNFYTSSVYVMGLVSCTCTCFLYIYVLALVSCTCKGLHIVHVQVMYTHTFFMYLSLFEVCIFVLGIYACLLILLRTFFFPLSLFHIPVLISCI